MLLLALKFHLCWVKPIPLPPLPRSAMLFSSVSLCGPNSWPAERVRGGAGQSPNPTSSVSGTMHFPVCVCEKLSTLRLVSAYC